MGNGQWPRTDLLHDELVERHRVENLKGCWRKYVTQVTQLGAHRRAARTARAACAAHSRGLDLLELGLLLDRQLEELGLI